MARVATSASWVLPALLLAAFVATPYLPMVDLPQHAAQIGTWLRIDDPTLLEASTFSVNLRTPYITAYVAARAIAVLVGVIPALKLVVWGCVTLHAVAFSLVLGRLGYPRWLAPLGLPLGLGYPFFYGFVSFIAAMPLVLFAVVAALRVREAPDLRNGAALAALLCAILTTHGFALGVAALIVGPLLVRGHGSILARLLPFTAPVALWAVWLLPAHSVRTIGATVWEPRVAELLVSPALWFATSSADHAALALGYGALALLLVAFGRPSRSKERWAPLLFMVVGFCTFPSMLAGFGPLHPRFAAFFPLTLLLAFEPRSQPFSPRVPLLVHGLCATWFALLTWRLLGFSRETAPIRDFVAHARPRLRVRPIVFDRDSAAFPGLPALLHLPAYYMTEKGGLQGYSFAMYPTSVIRYTNAGAALMGGGSEWHPEWFSAETELDHYDCVLVHERRDVGETLFGARRAEVAVDFHEGDWWAYRVEPKASATRESPSKRAM